MIILTETIPKAQILPISPATLAIPGDSLYCNFDCSESNLGAGGLRGICMYTSENLHASEVLLPAFPFREQLWIRMKLKNSDSLLIGCIYRSPSGDPVSSTEGLCNLFRHVCLTNPSHLLIVGDFNMPSISWNLGFASAPVGHYSHSFIDAINYCYLFQHVNQPTRYRHGENPRVLDLIFSNEEGMVKNLSYSAGLGASDHVILEFELTCYSVYRPSDSKLDIGPGNFKLLNSMLFNIDWDQLHEFEFFSNYAFFKKNVHECIRKAIPMSRPSNKKNNI